jgi:hypothetical protein
VVYRGLEFKADSGLEVIRRRNEGLIEPAQTPLNNNLVRDQLTGSPPDQIVQMGTKVDAASW